MESTLILGVGNILMRDDGVGVRAVEALARCPLPEGVEVLDGGTAGVDLVEAIAGRRKVIIVDAVEASAAPGSIFRLTGDQLGSGEGIAVSLHEFGLAEMVSMARALRCAPEEVVVFGVQPKDVSLGLQLSEEVAGSLPALIDLVLAEARGESGEGRGGERQP